ncbi:MAG: RluA family pseudouridine synthase [Treponema sp.]|jgi:23S rRNA pseudouridine1911/1915/1917 synthase|nr:RluA family pseudouridine synthase [Treponema sp.]
MLSYTCTVGEDIPPGLRLDRYVAEYTGLLTRSQIKSRRLSARLNGREVKISRPVKGGDLLELLWFDPPPTDLLPEDIPLDILYEDDRVVVVNKAQGMVVHPGAGNSGGTLANALLFRRRQRGLSGIQAGSFRPGIVHRLDKDTSGVIIAAYDDGALTFLAEQFKNRRVKKRYAALVRGTPPERRGALETFLSRDSRDRKKFAVSRDRGKTALTRYQVIRSWGAYSLLLLAPKTGRTHQLRVHMRFLGCPLLGDPIYGSPDFRFPGLGLMLHAKSLTLVLPGRGEAETFRTPLPPRFRDTIGLLEGKR